MFLMRDPYPKRQMRYHTLLSETTFLATRIAPSVRSSLAVLGRNAEETRTSFGDVHP